MSPHLFLQPSSNKVTFLKGLPSSVSSSTAPGPSPIPPIYSSTLCDHWGVSHELTEGKNYALLLYTYYAQQFHPVNTGHGQTPSPLSFHSHPSPEAGVLILLIHREGN